MHKNKKVCVENWGLYFTCLVSPELAKNEEMQCITTLFFIVHFGSTPGPELCEFAASET